MTETHLQQQVVQWLSLYARKCNFVYFAPMNENAMQMLKIAGIPKKRRMQIYQSMLKKGFLPGVSDLIILQDGKAYCIELKVGKNKQSEKQILFMNNVLKTGIDYTVAYSLEEVQAVVRGWGII